MRRLKSSPVERRALGDSLTAQGWIKEGRWDWLLRGSHVSAQIGYEVAPGRSDVGYTFAVVWTAVRDLGPDFGYAWPWTAVDGFNERFHPAPSWVFELAPTDYVVTMATEVLVPIAQELQDPDRYLEWLLTDGTWPGFPWLWTPNSRELLMKYAYIGTLLGVGSRSQREEYEAWLLQAGDLPADLAELREKLGRS